MKCEACQKRTGTDQPEHLPDLVRVASRTDELIGLVCPVCRTPHCPRSCEKCGHVFYTSSRRKLCRPGCKGESDTARFEPAC